MANKVRCPYCSEKFDLDDYVEEGDTVACPVCDGDLEVTGTDPVRVKKLAEDSYEEGAKGGFGEDIEDDDRDNSSKY